MCQTETPEKMPFAACAERVNHGMLWLTAESGVLHCLKRASIQMKKIVYASLFCLLSGAATAQTFYRWKDAQGVTHYTEQAPLGVSSTSIEINTGVTADEPASQPAQAAAPATTPATTAQAAPQTQAQTYQQRCDQYRQNLAQLKSDQQLTTTDHDGKLHAVTADERAKMEQNTTNMLTTCPPAAASK